MIEELLKAEVKEFFQELSQVDSPAYIELPLSEREWEKADDKKKSLTAFLFLLWKAGYPLKKVYHGWFYNELKDFILRVEGSARFLLLAKDRETGLYRVLFNDTLHIPKRITEFAENRYLLNELAFNKPFCEEKE